MEDIQAPAAPVYEVDLVMDYMLDQFPEDFECTACMLVQDNYLTCKHCSAIACVACLEGFSRSASKQVPQGKYECMICHKQDTMLPQNRILTDILGSLRFQCTKACQQVYPYRELKAHYRDGRCRVGYKRPMSPQRKPVPPG